MTFEGDPQKRYVPGLGPRHPQIVIVGESPGHEELEQLKPFVGPSGRFLNSLLSEAGISPSSCWITNVCKYFVPPSPKKRPVPFSKRAVAVGIDLQQCVEELRNEILSLQPNLIIGLGGTALYYLTGRINITDYRGSILDAFGIKTICTYHPAHILHSSGESTGYWNKHIMLFDLIRAYNQSKFPEKRLPYRTLQVCENSSQLAYFLDMYRNSNIAPSVDIEAYQCVPICVGLSYNKSHGMTVPLWNSMGIFDMGDNELARCWDLLITELAQQKVIGQNLGYDRDKLKRLGITIAGIKSDTMLKSFVINPELPKNLAFNTSIYTEEPFYKNEGMYEGSITSLMEGCARDACVTKEVDDCMDSELDELGARPYYERFLLPLQNLYARIEEVGFKVDENIRLELLKKYIEKDEILRHELFKLCGEYINVASPLQVEKLLYDTWKIPSRSGTGEEIITGIINRSKDPNIKKGCETILEDRRIRKTVSSYLYALPDFDGRMRTSYFLCLKTGRSSSNQQEPPIRPDIQYKGYEEGKKVNKKQTLGMAFQTITKHGEIGPDIRRMLVVDDGYVFLQADSSQAEARVIFKLAEDNEALELIDKVDYHALTTTWFLGGHIDDYDKRVVGFEKPERFLGKTLRHAGHLGAGGKRAAIEVNTQARKYKIPITITEREADNALNIFHAKQPRIRHVFQAQIIQELERSRKLIPPVPYGFNGMLGAPRTFYERWDNELFREAFSYIPQRTVSENTKAAALRIAGSIEHNIPARADWIRIHVESHDALLVSVPIERELEAAKILKEELERPIDFSRCSLPRTPLVIPAEIERGFNYYELSKFKFI